MTVAPIRLGVNIDHVATLRNARGGALPDPVRAAEAAIAAGADGITAHLREDRRHIRDADMPRLKALPKPLNFEMAATDDMKAIALDLKPHAVCLVPERREERTTEGGLDVAGQHNHLKPYVAALTAAGIRVSMFIAADPRQIEASKSVGAPVIEIHTGAWCEAYVAGEIETAKQEFARIREGAAFGDALGLEVHCGHGLDFDTAAICASLPQVKELNIGHFLIGESVFLGLDEAIRRMRAAIDRGRARAGQA
jgi:pyridoxine 5-phosphate synthase